MLPPQKRMRLSGWGHFPTRTCVTYRPEKVRDVDAVYAAHDGTVLMRGSGKSYGDAALNREGVMLTERLNRFLAFDESRGVIRTQGGVTLAEILQVVVPKGWFLPVLPGTKYATIGGALACNIHGKNHYKVGDIAPHVEEAVLRLSTGEVVSCSPENNADAFWATAGGMGMTGCVEEVSLKLLPITSAHLSTERRRVKNIEEMAEHFRSGVARADYMMGWIDHFGEEDELGRGVFESATHVDRHDQSLWQYGEEKVFNVPCHIPSWVLNKYSMHVYNWLRFRGVGEKPVKETRAFEDFFHPLDGLGNWNKLYGKRGFLQYQFLVPESMLAVEQLRKVLEMIQRSGQFSFLAVIKYHGPHEGMLSFPSDGFSVALDFPNTSRVHALLDQVDDYLCTIGGRVYLAKDARLKPYTFERMYGEHLAKWRRVVQELDPGRKIQSTMDRRLGMRGV